MKKRADTATSFADTDDAIRQQLDAGAIPERLKLVPFSAPATIYPVQPRGLI